VKQIWHSDQMNALRKQHLEGLRKENPVCSQCGQLSHCLPDNIDAFRTELLPHFLEYAGDKLGKIPGNNQRRIIPVTIL